MAAMGHAMKVVHQRILSDADGETSVELWCDLSSIDDIVDIIEWLKLARTMMEKWEEIRAGRVG
jgi:hypothetical protein